MGNNPKTFSDPHATQAQLTRILNSQAFAKAPSLSRLLNFLVTEAANGRAEELKEYTVGAAISESGEDFDPQSNTIVRVQARRLRSKLRQYYADEGTNDPLKIEIPEGTYAPVFEDSEASDARAPSPDEDPLAASRRSRPRSLPYPHTSLIGRENDIAYLTGRLLHPDVGLMTLTGPGGSGKTRLAIEVARVVKAHYPGGLHYVPLAGLTAPDAVERTIAEAMGFRAGSGFNPNRFAETLRETVREPLLLVLDNFEHLLRAAGTVSSILEACPALTILVTSRAVLNIYGEHEYPVPPLPLPSEELRSTDEFLKNPAIQLFVDRAVATKPSFQLHGNNADDVRWICARLDGLPLAIELASAYVKLLSPKAIRDRLQNQLHLLKGGPRDAPARHQTLTRAMEWSYELLSPTEQRLFRRLAVFSGSFSVEAAEAVGNAWQDLDGGILEHIGSLVDKSMLQQVEPNVDAGGGDEDLRFLMLETLREYAFEQLEAAGEARAAQKAHAAYFLIRAEERDSERWDEAWIRMCELEHDNLIVALDRLIKQGPEEWAIRLGLALAFYWDARELFAEGHAYLDALLKLPLAADAGHSRAALLSFYLAFQSDQDFIQDSKRVAYEALELYRQLGDREGEAGALNSIGVFYRTMGDLSRARRYFEQALKMCREFGQKAEVAGVLNNFADVVQEEPALARSLLEEAISIFKEVGDRSSLGWSISKLGDIECQLGNLEDARRYYEKASRTFASAGDPWGVARAFTDLGYLDTAQGNLEESGEWFLRALELLEPLNHQRGIAFVLYGIAQRAENLEMPETAVMLAASASSIKKRLGTNWAGERTGLPHMRRQLVAAVDPAAWERGAKMPLAEVVALARHSLS